MNNNFIKTLLAIIFILVVSWFLFLKYLLSDIETITYDWRAKLATEKYSLSKHDPNIILLAADDETTKILENYPEANPGRWPWSRKLWGDVVNFISKGNPKAIVFDLKFEGEADKDSDNFFAQSVKDKNIVIATALSLPRNNENINPLLENLNKKVQEKYNISIDELNNEQIDQKLSEFYTNYYKRSQLDERLALTPNEDYYKELLYGNQKAKKLLDNITFYERSSIYDELIKNAAHVGVINLKSSRNTVFRHHVPLYKLVLPDATSYIPSLPLAAVISAIPEEERSPFVISEKFLTIGKRLIPIDSEGRILLNWHGPGETYETIPVANVILSSALEQGKITSLKEIFKISPDYFKDKIVVIGQTSAGTDLHPTPMASIYPGPEIITTAIDNLLNDTDVTKQNRRKFIIKSSPEIDILLTLILCLIIGYSMRKAKTNAVKFQVFIFSVMLYLALAICAFIHPQVRIWLNMTYPLLFMFLTGISTYAYITFKENQEKKQVELLFGKFVSPQILEKLLADKTGLSNGGQRKVMSVLFADIRGFTTLSEQNSPDKVIAILNEYITEMVEVILDYNGTLDKYIGDAIMAFYNDPVEMEDHALRAVQTAIAMRTKLAELNKKWESEGKQPLNIGIGINTGEMIVGHMGSPRLVDYTVIGDNVNLASRIESLTKNYNVNILISETTYNQVKDKIEADYIDEVIVKGKTNAVKIYAVK